MDSPVLFRVFFFYINFFSRVEILPIESDDTQKNVRLERTVTFWKRYYNGESYSVNDNLESVPVPSEEEQAKWLPPSVAGKELEFLVHIFSTWHAVAKYKIYEGGADKHFAQYYDFLFYMMTTPKKTPILQPELDFALHSHLLNPKEFWSVRTIVGFSHVLNLGNDDC